MCFCEVCNFFPIDLILLPQTICYKLGKIQIQSHLNVCATKLYLNAAVGKNRICGRTIEKHVFCLNKVLGSVKSHL